MNMTHYMELLATNQPWNLIIFMAIPVVLAETVAITELYMLFTRQFDGRVRTLNRLAGITSGVVFIGIIAYLTHTAVVPITIAGEWRTLVDVVAVNGYLLSGVPMVLVALLDLGLIHKKETDQRKLGWHAAYISAFLILAHVAMIAGMMNPGLFDSTLAGHAAHPIEM